MPDAPDHPDHLDPKEATEARLCAYLEGELSPQERIDIEKHLQSNPQHRQLLIDLAETREWMRSIPQESAPPELAEAFAAQMERSMLLDDRRQTAGSTISHLPQYLLLAAIVMLTLGLGVLIAIMLRGGSQSYTIAPQAKTPAGSTVEKTSPLKSSAAKSAGEDQPKLTAPGRDLLGTYDKIESDVANTPPPTERRLGKPSQFAGRQATAAAPLVATPTAPGSPAAAGGGQLHEALLTGQRAANRCTICLVVSSNNPSATAEQVRKFFTSNQLAFDDEHSPNFAADEQKLAAITPEAIKSFGLNAPGPGVAGGGETGGAVNPNTPSNTPNGEAQNNAANNLQTNARATPSQNFSAQNNANAQSANAQNKNSASNNAGAPAIPGEANQGVQQQSPLNANDLDKANFANRSQFAANAAPSTQPSTLLNGAAAQNITSDLVFIGHDLTPIQLDLLRNTLTTVGADQTVKTINLPPPTAAPLFPQTAPGGPAGTPTIAAGQTLTITVPQLVGPGVDKTNVTRVAADGTISLPMLLDPVAASGSTPAQLQDRIAARYREANLIPNATVTVAVSAPTTKPATRPAITAAVPATMPATSQPTGVAKATTQPAGAGRVDVVVEIRMIHRKI